MLHADSGVTSEQIETIIASLRRDCDFADEYRLARSNSLFDHSGNPPPDADALVMEAHADEYRYDLARNHINGVRDVVKERAAAIGLTIEPGTIDERLIGRAVLNEYIRSCGKAADLARERIAILNPDAGSESHAEISVRSQNIRAGAPHSSPAPAQFEVCETTKVEQQNIIQNASQLPDAVDDPVDELNPRLKRLAGNVAPARNLSLDTPWDEIWQLFLDDRKKFDRIKERPAKLTSSLNLWQGVHGCAPVWTWTESQAAELRRLFVQLPSKYGQESQWTKLKDLRIIAAAFQSEIEQASTEEEKRQLLASGCKDKTWNRHNSTLRQFWPWAIHNGLIAKDTPNPFEQLHIDLDEDAEPWEGGSQLRMMWEDAPLRKLLNSPLFLGSKSANDRLTPGTCIVRDVLYWGVVILAHTGMRREEICQLKRKHVCFDDETGIWYFDLKAKGLRLKEKASKRWVPITDNLHRLGIVAALFEGRAAEEMLFPELSASGADGAYGTKLGNMFFYYRKTYDERSMAQSIDGSCVKIYRPLMDLHSFRTTVSTKLMRLGVPQAHAEEVTGHKSEARRTAFEVYDRGATLTILKEALDRLVLPIDIDAMVRAAGLA